MSTVLLTKGVKKVKMAKISKNSVGIRPGITLLQFFIFSLIGLFICILIAVHAHFTEPETFLDSLIINLCMWFSIFGCSIFVFNILKPLYLSTHITLLFIFVMVGSFIGVLTAALTSGVQELLEPPVFFELVFDGFLYGILIVLFLNLGGLLAETFIIIKDEKLKQITNEKKLLESNLRLLQAQIEPHFLFNTLSSIRSLLDSDAENGKTMLDDLTQYLRASLSKIRKETTTINQEMKMIRSYFNIFKNRLKERLDYTIDIPEGLMDHPLPSMLLQPLIENAIIHGIEPKIEGGRISIAVSNHNDDLRIEINDTGMGIRENFGPSVGLNNIRKRLQALFGDRGKLFFEENIPCGVKAIIEVPYVR